LKADASNVGGRLYSTGNKPAMMKRMCPNRMSQPSVSQLWSRMLLPGCRAQSQ
jgi:hypothetical protein